MRLNLNNITIALIIILSVFAIGFFIGRATIQNEVIIEQKRGETVYGGVDTAYVNRPVETKGEIKYLPYYLWRTDTVFVSDIEYVNIEPDTAKILEDFITKRDYSFNVFDDDTIGKLDVKQVVQYNKLQSFDYAFTPIITTKTVLQRKLFTPFIGASYNTIGLITFSGGVFINNLGVEYGYVYQMNNPYNINMNGYGVPSNSTGHSFGIKYKF